MSEHHINIGATTSQVPARRLLDTSVLAVGLAIAVAILVLGVGSSIVARSILPSAPGWLGCTVLVLVAGVAMVGWRLFGQFHAEISARRRASEEDRRNALTDPLTGCYNRRSIGPASDTLIAAAAESDDAIAVIMIDVDNFKTINDTYGHRVGDMMLQQCASRIAALLPTGSVMARLGGDEFACVLAYAPAHPYQVDRLANAIVAEAAAPVEVDGFHGSLTVSLGLSHSEAPRLASDNRTMIDTLLHQADVALYQAKKQGRDRFLWYTDHMEDALRHRCDLEAGIRAGLTQGEFVPYYQPVVELATNRLVGFEMLARWHSPSFGLLEPEVFIPVAEEIGVITELSEALIGQALRDARDWRPELTLAINISPVHLRDPWLAQKLLKLCQVEQFPRNRLEIEISETCLHGDLTGVITLLSSLKNQGVSLCLDDFGMGFCSLSQLRNLAFNRIKLHRDLVSAMSEDSDARAIVESVTTLGRGLGLPLAVEGIDTPALADQLAELGEFRGQGYIFGEAQPTSETGALITRYLGPAPLPGDHGHPQIVSGGPALPAHQPRPEEAAADPVESTPKSQRRRQA